MDGVGWAPGGGLRASFTVKCRQLCCRLEHFQEKVLGKVFPERVTSELASLSLGSGFRPGVWGVLMSGNREAESGRGAHRPKMVPRWWTREARLSQDTFP